MTNQRPENLVFNGDEMHILSYPSLPVQDSRIIKNHDTRIGSSDCWRGYVGTWKINDNKLYLVDLIGGYAMLSTEPIFADWFSGIIRGFISDGEIKVEISNGLVAISRITVDLIN